jgi:hypothetical protein
MNTHGTQSKLTFATNFLTVYFFPSFSLSLSPLSLSLSLSLSPPTLSPLLSSSYLTRSLFLSPLSLLFRLSLLSSSLLTSFTSLLFPLSSSLSIFRKEKRRDLPLQHTRKLHRSFQTASLQIIYGAFTIDLQIRVQQTGCQIGNCKIYDFQTELSP